MRTEIEAAGPDQQAPGTRSPLPALPTSPSSVVWSEGHAYVLEPVWGRPRWLGVDDRGRPEALSGADLQRRGWTRTCRR